MSSLLVNAHTIQQAKAGYAFRAATTAVADPDGLCILTAKIVPDVVENLPELMYIISLHHREMPGSSI